MAIDDAMHVVEGAGEGLCILDDCQSQSTMRLDIPGRPSFSVCDCCWQFVVDHYDLERVGDEWVNKGDVCTNRKEQR